MIGLLVKIPFHSQIKRTEPRFAEEIAAAVGRAATASAARILPSEESYFLAFDESSSPCRLRAAEAARLLLDSFRSLNPRLHGWVLLIDSCSAGDEEDLRQFRRRWYGIRGDGLFIGPGTVQRFRRYFQCDESRAAEHGGCAPVLDALYAHPPIPEEEIPRAPSGPALEELVQRLGELAGVGQTQSSSLAVLGAGRAPAEFVETALDRLYGQNAAKFLRLRASAVASSPYGPMVDGLASFAAPGGGELGGTASGSVSGADRLLLTDLGLILDFLARSPFREGYAPALDIRLRVCVASALRLYARHTAARSLPAFVILDGIERFPHRSLELVRLLLELGLAEDGLRCIALGSQLPPSLADRGIPTLALPEGDWAPSGADGFALRARARLARCGEAEPKALSRTGGSGRSRVALAVAVLKSLPAEYSELLLALSLGEESFRDEDMDDFLDSLGYVGGIRGLAYPQLAALGFLVGRGRPRLAFPEVTAAAEALLKDGGAGIKAAFAQRLLSLHGQRRILPSLALYRRIRLLGADAITAQSLRLFLDCAAADSVYGPSLEPDEALDSPLASHFTFLRAYAANDRETSELAAADLENNIVGGDPLAAATASLARAALDYSARSPGSAAKLAKNALISLHALSAPRAEARAHRILGLCSLAQGQIQEGADYLANASEIAEGVDDALGCILSAQAEASAHFVLGDMSRALARTSAFAAVARGSFRADWEMVAAFMEGRIAFELGAYADAEEAFDRVRAQAQLYSQADAELRAGLWMGRAAAAAGEGDRATDMLSRGGEDVEALWFSAELEYWEGRREEAARLAERAVALAPPSGFASADAFDWSSGFASIEGRSVGFVAGRSYLADQLLAFRDFCVGLASPELARERSERLALQTREERLSALHPSLHLYLFYRFLILRELDESSMDSATVLSKAFKALQIRAARMSDAVRKDSFMERNRWNRALVNQARAHKLM
ncbi:MAG TPA: hypothetical protein VMC79_07645 [Rectinemataceae bacterium]|nr:hypothetical protein [Rectinemataceae bacterium]